VCCSDSGEGPLVVSLLDGKIAALDQETGGRLWEYDTGQPLVSNKGTASRGNDSKATVFPGADGSLYAYHHKERSFEVRLMAHGQYVCASSSLTVWMVQCLGSTFSSRCKALHASFCTGVG